MDKSFSVEKFRAVLCYIVFYGSGIRAIPFVNKSYSSHYLKTLYLKMNVTGISKTDV
jgi:hypothetical protein